MDELLDRVEKKGRAEGRAEGRVEGRVKGRAEGIEETRVAAIKSVMEGLRYTAQQAMELLKIPMADRSKYLAKL